MARGVGNEVKRLRQAREWNQTELAFHAGLAPSVISEIENGKRDPSARTLRKLAEALKVDVGDLFPSTRDYREACRQALAACQENDAWAAAHILHSVLEGR